MEPAALRPYQGQQKVCIDEKAPPREVTLFFKQTNALSELRELDMHACSFKGSFALPPNLERLIVNKSQCDGLQHLMRKTPKTFKELVVHDISSVAGLGGEWRLVRAFKIIPGSSQP